MGKIVMPKNSALLNEIESVLKIYYENEGWLSNDIYKSHLKAMIGDDQYSSSYTKKAQITSYFGFTVWEDINRPQSKRKITESGKAMYQAIKQNDTAAIQKILMDSLEKVTFGRNNYGCPESNSDVEPPKLFIRASMDLGYLTYKEFAYLLWKLEDVGQNYTDALSDIRHFRSTGKVELGEAATKYTDCKPIMILVRWGFLVEDEGDSTGGKHIRVAPAVVDKYESRLRNLKVYNIDMNVGEIVERTTEEMFTPEWFRKKAKEYPTFDSEADSYRTAFLEEYGIETLKKMSGKEILTKIFLNSETTDNLCHELEYNSDSKNLFGSIRNGFSTKYGLYYNKKKETWAYGSSSKQEFITEKEAIIKGTEFRDFLVAGGEILLGWNNFSSVEDYKALSTKLSEVTDGNVGRIWFLKYYQMLRPESLPTIYSDSALDKALQVLDLDKGDSPIENMGKIKLFIDQCEISNALACRILWDNYPSGEELSQEIPEDSKENEQQFRNWMSKQATVNGRCCTPAMISNNCSALKKVCHLMEIVEYPEVDSIFQITNIDTFIDIKNIIKGHPDYDEVNLACNNRFLSTGLKWYEKYLNEIDVNDEGEPVLRPKNCLEIERFPRTNRLHPLNCIIYGAPGTGKTYATAEYALAIINGKDVDKTRKNTEQRKAVMAEYNDYVRKGQVVFTTFHQSYGYEEFIQGLRPDTESEQMSFVTVDGVFKRIADAALIDRDNNYVIIIDEINRANISKVFGELITLVEDDKRWGEVNETCATLQSGDIFAVPNNLYIVGTMNSADKSISLIDVAIRRRFEFFEQYPDAELIDDATLKSVFKKINELLADSLESSDLLIGHSYFMGKTVDELCPILNNSIIPLLYEYFYDNKKKVIGVLKEALKDLSVEIKDRKISRVYVEPKEVGTTA